MKNLKTKIKRDIKKFDIENSTQLVNYFYNNYIDENLIDTNKFNYLLLCDRHTKIEDKFNLDKKLNYLLENRKDLIKI